MEDERQAVKFSIISMSVITSQEFIIFLATNLIVVISALLLTSKVYTLKQKIKKGLGAYLFGMTFAMVLYSVYPNYVWVSSIIMFILIYGTEEFRNDFISIFSMFIKLLDRGGKK